MRRVTNVIVANAFVAGDVPETGTIAAANNWVDGKVTILKEDLSELVLLDVTAGSAYDGPIYITRFDRQNDLRISNKIEKREIRRYAYKDFAAETLKRDTITIPAVPVVGAEYGLYVIDPHDREVVYNGRKLYFVKARTAVKADLTNDLVALINNTPSSAAIVTAANVGNDLQLNAIAGKKFMTGYERHHTFEIALYAGLIGQAVANNIVHGLGCGEHQEVYNLEWDFDLGYKGHLNRVLYADSPETYTAVGTNYDMFVIEHNNLEGDTVGDNANAGRPLTTILAFNEAGTGNAAFKTLLDAYMGIELDNLEGDAE